VEPGNPLSLTSDKSTEAYRNWWPGPDRAMTAFMNRSIDLIEGIAHATDNRINLNRRGYVFATGDAGKIPFLHEMARSAEARGGAVAWRQTRQRPRRRHRRAGRAGALSSARGRAAIAPSVACRACGRPDAKRGREIARDRVADHR